MTGRSERPPWPTGWRTNCGGTWVGRRDDAGERTAMNAILEREGTMSDRLAGAGPDAGRLDCDLVELALVLPQWQVDALASAARGRGLTAGQVLRRLVGAYCATLTTADR